MHTPSKSSVRRCWKEGQLVQEAAARLGGRCTPWVPPLHTLSPSQLPLPLAPADPSPCEGLKPLRSVASGQRWDGTHSFYSPWR
jgi:hypothetical protein